jgi:alpha-L-rhamnosidase
MAQTYAHLLGFAEEEKEYAALAIKVKEAFRREFFDKDSYTVKGDCQSSTAMMVFHNLAEEDEIPHLVEKLLLQIERDNGHLDFGVLGCKAVMETLGKYGHAESAMKLLTNPTYPSMKHWLNMGTTTLLECWNGGGSRNHHMFSCVSAFFYKYVAGIRATSPAYRSIEFAPAVESSLSNAYASVNTPYGKAECGFEKADGKTVVNITIPSSCKGTLKLFGKEYALESGKHTVEI